MVLSPFSQHHSRPAHPVFPGGLLFLAALFLFPPTNHSQPSTVKNYPREIREIHYPSSADNSEQAALFFAPADNGDKRPLLVALHTWSGDYRQAGGETAYARWCVDQGWAFIHPNFRGPNWTPEAMGSDLAVGDIVSAVAYAKNKASIDEDRIYCVGVSGGGHASLLVAGRAPEIWAGVSAWVGIYDIAQWHSETKKAGRGYWKHIEKALGGDPHSDPQLKAGADHRSPKNWLSKARGVNLDINHGITDGRTGSVPFSHSLHAFNRLLPAQSPARIPPSAIAEAWSTGSADPLPDTQALVDPLYGERRPLYRKSSGNTRVTLFQGGHEIIHLAALNWLAQQRKGQAAKWQVEKTADLKTSEKETQSGK